MTDEKKQLDHLTRDSLKEVKGGIPYEQPGLIELSTIARTCSQGEVCKDGGEKCEKGSLCGVGITPDPSPY